MSGKIGGAGSKSGVIGDFSAMKLLKKGSAAGGYIGGGPFDGVFTSRYQIYKLYLINILPTTDAARLDFFLRTSSGNVDGYLTQTYGRWNDGTGGSEASGKAISGDQTRLLIADYMDTSSTVGGSGEITIFNPTGSEETFINFFFGYWRDSVRIQAQHGTSFLNGTHIGFYMDYSSGNIAAGYYKLYGIKE